MSILGHNVSRERGIKLRGSDACSEVENQLWTEMETMESLRVHEGRSDKKSELARLGCVKFVTRCCTDNEARPCGRSFSP